MRLRWTAPARRDLVSLWEHISEDSPKAADAVVDRIDEVAAILRRKPKAGRRGQLPGTRELVVTRTPYILIYETDSRETRILRVIHGRQAWPPAQ